MSVKAYAAVAATFGVLQLAFSPPKFGFDCEAYVARNTEGKDIHSIRWRKSENPSKLLECVSSDVYGPYAFVSKAKQVATTLDVKGACSGPGALLRRDGGRLDRPWQWLVFCPEFKRQ